MTYTSIYTQSDLSTMIIDLIGWIFATLVDNVALIVLLVVLGIIVYLCRGLLSGLFSMIHFK